LSLALGLLPASCILAADTTAATAGDNKPAAEVHADAKDVHKPHHAVKSDAKDVHQGAKASPKKKLRWTNRRHMKKDMPAAAGDAKDATDPNGGGEQAAGDEQKSGN
jgi:hypothetical protein